MPLKKHKEYSAKIHSRQQTSVDTNLDSQSETIVTQVGPNDILLGRGAPQTDHEGNARLRQMVVDMQPEYAAAKRQKEKQLVAVRIVERIEAQGGRFLRKIGGNMREQEQQAVKDGETRDHSQQYSSVSDGWAVSNDRKQILEKVKQLFRDMGPESRERRQTRRLYRYRKLGLKPGERSECSQASPTVDEHKPKDETPLLLKSNKEREVAKSTGLASERAQTVTDVHPSTDSSQPSPSGMAGNTGVARHAWDFQNATNSQFPFPPIGYHPLYANPTTLNPYFQSTIGNPLSTTPPMQCIQQQMMSPQLALAENSLERILGVSSVMDSIRRASVPPPGRAPPGYSLPSPLPTASTCAVGSPLDLAQLSSLPAHRRIRTSTESNTFRSAQTASGITSLPVSTTNELSRKPSLGESVTLPPTRKSKNSQQQSTDDPRATSHERNLPR